MRRSLAFAAACMVICGCGQSRSEADSAALRNTLGEMRKAIQNFRTDKQRPPHDLNELVAAHYLRSIPNDPITGASDWRVTTEERVAANEDFSTAPATAKPEPAIVDVHSSAAGRDAHGKAWAEY